MSSLTDQPLAAPGLTSYRARSPYGWVMIGAKNHEDAIREAKRSTDNPTDLQIWDAALGTYTPVKASQMPVETPQRILALTPSVWVETHASGHYAYRKEGVVTVRASYRSWAAAVRAARAWAAES